MGKKEVKTNAVRILERNKIEYELINYECDEFIDGMHTIEKTGAPAEQTYKTLVMQGKSKQYYVFVIPIAKEVDLKAAARSVGEKSVEMIHVKDLTAITGCPWWLQSTWYEESVSYRYRCICRTV